MGLRSEK